MSESKPCGRPFCCGAPGGVCTREAEEDAAAERSAHVVRSPAPAAATTGGQDAIVEIAPGVCRLRVAIERDEALAEVARLRAGWKPIATAPRSPDTFILVWHPKYETMHVVRWDGGDASQFEILDERLEYLKDVYPTHWMPLPAPPENPDTAPVVE